ncbi:MAG: YitT family protein [Bacilli bacterium]|nr:YitT family protein [Bacilli bacterium]
MRKKRTLQSKIESFLYNHIWLKTFLNDAKTTIATIVSAFIFSIGVVIFVAPLAETNLHSFVTGGASGIAQVIELFINLIVPSSKKVAFIYSIAFAVVNIPIAIIGFKGIGVRFASFTVLNVGLVSLFTYLFKNVPAIATQMNKLAIYISSNGGGFLSRAIFGGVCTGLSSAIAFKVETSTGGIDVISYYLALKKSTSVGKYSTYINGVIIAVYTALMLISNKGAGWEASAACLLYSVIYMLVAMLIVDTINVRNKKVQLQIITKNRDLPHYLLAQIPHTATIVQGKGAFTGEDKVVVYMVIQSAELKKTIKIIKELDADSFVNVTTLQQVYGRFFIRPIK